MGLIRELERIINSAEEEYRTLLAEDKKTAYRRELYVEGKSSGVMNRIYHCDNLKLLSDGVRDGSLREKIDLIYCDPPFFTQAKQEASVAVYSYGSKGKTPVAERLRLTAYDDVWGRSMADYLRMIAVRLYFMRDALKESGSIFIHLDWHAVHAVRLIMDEIFGESNFVNEIIWTYKSGGATKRHFSRKHDSILFYSKSGEYRFNEQEKEKSYNRGFKPYRFRGVEEYKDEVGWYTLVHPKDVWQMDMVGRSSAERLNYATQKPEALLEKIIKAVTLPGDLCADFFCGSGTLAAAAAKLGRAFICADAGSMAIGNAIKRPILRGTGFELWTIGDGAQASEQKVPLRPADIKKADELAAREPDIFDDICIEGAVDEADCLHADVVRLRTAKGKLELSLEQSCGSARDRGFLRYDVFGRKQKGIME